MTFGVRNDIYFTILILHKTFIMIYHNSTATGYNYIDSEIDTIKDRLSKDEQEKLDKLCEQIRSVGFSEGYDYLRKEHKSTNN